MTISAPPVSQLEVVKAAVRCQQKGQFDEAERLCMQVCSIAPNQPDALHLLAIIQAQTGRYNESNDFFAKAIAAAPTRADYHGNYANALVEQGRSDDAINHCERSLALNPQSAEVHNVLGIARLSQHKPEEAIVSFHKALELRPRFPHALNNLGNALHGVGKVDEAINCYRQVLGMQPNYPDACNNLGQALKGQGRIEEARSCFVRALELHPGFEKAVGNLAEVDPVWLEPLNGRRLYLRRYREEDATYLLQIFQNADFMARYNNYIPHLQNVEDLARKLHLGHATHPCQSKCVDWIILRKDTGRPIGIANLAEIQFPHRRAEFLVGLPDPEERTSGEGLEASLLVMDFAFNNVGLNKLTSVVYGYNTPAQQSTLALGFTQESYLREHIAAPGSKQLIDVYGNGLLQNDFRNNKRLARLSMRLIQRDITLVDEIS